MMTMTHKAVELSRGVDTIIRCHDPKRLAEMDRALFSLLHQSYGPVHVIVVTQGFSKSSSDQVNALVQNYKWEAFGHKSPTIINVEADEGLDLRAHLLNVGLQKLSCRYFAFLDSDDYLYGSAYEYLIEHIVQSGVAIAFGNIVRKDVRAFDDFVYTRNRFADQFRGSGLEDLAIDNFCPIHSFVVDRSVIEPADIRFDEELNRLEDYEFLLRICTKYSSLFSSRSRYVGVYNWHLDGRASNQFAQDGERVQMNRVAWNVARRHVWRLKCLLRDKISISH
jgi:hypothetical protein